MSSSKGPARPVHQDYIARIRYSNALPPPPNPPKLLEIPGTGLAGGQYTSAGYAARLAREQPLNIEADAELGMPIDLVGISGVFDGDDKAISVRTKPQLHPADKALLRPLASLGKANVVGAVSFLRRTEYTSSQGTQHFASSTSKDLLRVKNDKRSRVTNKDDPINIIRHIVKGFDIAYPKDAYRGEDSETKIRGAAPTDEEVRAWAKPKHPTKPDLELLDSYPVLPDLDAIPPVGAYLTVKFITNPGASSEFYDSRLDVACLLPLDDAARIAAHEQKLAEWDPNSDKPQPIPEYEYDYYLPTEESAVRGIKRKFDVHDPEKDDPSLYTDEVSNGVRGFKYDRVRTYETYQQSGDASNKWNNHVALALHDENEDDAFGEGSNQPKAAYIYPVMQYTRLRAKRNIAAMAYATRNEDQIDTLNVTIRGVLTGQRFRTELNETKE
ncbi:Hypothetical protein R9X50_00580100 [Acrodontium crateriforme]|uniref:Paf1-domain-containing protein n=1 Tax=Acrodontium crateriforme TaxID=150365 RepID=A0AAQ3R697_9PEZI|nr:Hypothetical protein R9X50_00580100 [Acrodontium crateriforme]